MRHKDTTGLSQILGVTKHEMRNQMDVQLKALGLTAAQYTALSMLEERNGLTNAELARSCYVTPQTMIRIITQLKNSKLVKAKTESPSSRNIDIHLTQKAMDLLCDAHIVVDTLEKKMLKGFSKSQTKEIIDELRRLLKILKANN